MLTMRREDFPSGDYNAPNAPWNRRECSCPDCDGDGYIYRAFSLRTGKDIRVTRAAYICLPEDEDEAAALGQHYCKSDWQPERCDRCDGLGTIER